jgi:lipopolysaccharide export system permease protein
MFKKFYLDTFVFFLAALFIFGTIVWTIQAMNYFDFVTEEGHGLKIYLIYSILNFPKIIHRLFPFIFFISLFYTIFIYEKKNELNIFWINGVKKIRFLKKTILFSIFLMIFQIFLGSYISPKSQFKAREYLRDSNVDFFTSLLKPGKFINVVKNLTIFFDQKNEKGEFKNIFIEDTRNNNSKMIYSKSGNLIENNDLKVFKLLNGSVISNQNNKFKIFKFDEIDFNLKDLETKTIMTPKIQEINIKDLINCFFLNSITIDFICEKRLQKEIKQEIIKRIYKPIYIPIITLFCCFMIIVSSKNKNYKIIKNMIFLSTFIIIVISEVGLRYVSKSDNLSNLYVLIPIIIFIGSYFIFKKMDNNA